MIQKPILNTLCGSQKEAAKHAPDKMVAIKEPLNRKRMQANTSQDAQLNFTKCSFLSRHKSPTKTK